MDHMALIGVHGLQGDIPAVFDHFDGNFIGQALEGFLPLGPVVLRVNVNPHPVGPAPVDRVVGQLLDGVQGLPRWPMRAPSFRALQGHKNPIVPFGGHVDGGLHPHVGQQAGEKGADSLLQVPRLGPGTGEAGASALAGPLGAASAGRAGVAAGFGWGPGRRSSPPGETGASSWETS